MKKILLFTRPLVPPWDEGSKNLAFEIARHNEGDFVFHLLTDKSEKLSAGNWKNPEKIALEKIFSSEKLDFGNKLKLLKRLFTIKPSDFDLIHFLFAPRPLTSFLFRYHLKNFPVKTIQTLATLNKIEKYGKEKIKQILFADLVVAQSRFTYEKLKQLNIPAQQIYPGIDLEKFVSQPKDEKMMAKLGLKKDDFILLFTGEYARLEAIDDILDAFEILKKDNQAEKVKIILACRLKTSLDRQIKSATQNKIVQKNWQKHFVFLDFVDNMTKLYNLANLNIFPVRKMEEKFDVPLVLIESMACGKTVLVSDLPVLTEIIKDGISGAVVPVANPQALAEKIIFLKNNPGINNDLALAGQTFAHKHFDIKKISRQYQQVYQKLLS